MEIACEEGKPEIYFSKKMKTEQDATGMPGNRHWLNKRLMLTMGADGGSLGYFAHASAKFTEARLSQTSQNVRIGGFVPPFFSLSTTPYK